MYSLYDFVWYLIRKIVQGPGVRRRRRQPFAGLRSRSFDVIKFSRRAGLPSPPKLC